MLYCSKVEGGAAALPKKRVLDGSGRYKIELGILNKSFPTLLFFEENIFDGSAKDPLSSGCNGKCDLYFRTDKPEATNHLDVHGKRAITLN